MLFLHEAAIFLAAAIIAVTLFNKLGLGSVLGYLVAGVVIGPWGLGFIRDVESILHFSELGVVLLLFLIGLEMRPSRLWVLRRSIFGMGLVQVVATAVLLGLTALALGLPVATATIVGLGLSLSSTAFVLQLLAEKKQLTTLHGRAAFAILLFQDLAIIPLLAILPLLGTGGASLDASSMWQSILMGVAALVILVVGGHFLLRPVFRVISATRSHEIFVATSLMIIVASTLLMEQAGLSMALGAFIAGVLLADSEYRHEVEANIEPFKGLLLGLFFIAVGMSVNIGQMTAEPVRIFGLVMALLAIKFVVLYVLGRLFRLPARCSRNLAFVLPQGGEFAFVLFTAAVSYNVLDQALADSLILIVSLSMALTPLLILVNEKILHLWLDGRDAPVFDSIDNTGTEVIIAGFGRVGQIVGRVLRVRKIPFTALEINPMQVDFVRKFGGKIYYGDASRIELLRAAKADRAKIFVLAIDDIEGSIKTVETVRKNFPHLKIIVRARNRHHVHRLMDVGVKLSVRETFLSSLKLAEHVLCGLGESMSEVRATIDKFQEHDEANLIKQHAIHHDESKLIQSVRDAAADLEELFEQDNLSPYRPVSEDDKK